ncbi:AAA family ATPase [Pseudanabaena sp. FACHB-2040]|uniref:ATP-dependent nuclease n=1 Tax=Pseudanabaena sp. FACHB-2040 TaxID=2692859 RepID=UPI0016842B06|nr:AAA family ATPase [Pseudanabaena sp. FACHB-2040]MBD2256631.1 AAA family ATPase [Pseudanabaena sp. FACHB-2040]
MVTPKTEVSVRIYKIELSNFRSFSEAEIKLSSRINLFIGPNNSGKSTLLKSIAWIQQGFPVSIDDIRLSKQEAHLIIELEDVTKDYFSQSVNSNETIQITLNKPGNIRILATHKDARNPANKKITFDNTTTSTSYSYSIRSQEPDNFIYPYFSRRKTSHYDETINLSSASSITGNFQYLYSKIDRISNSQLPANREYVEACQEILGFQITAVPSTNGKRGVYVVNNFEHVPLDKMGEGIANIVGLVVDLCVAENQLFLIEEPENDVHPKALKKLLKLIVEKSKTNQFIITTHSNIVVKHLGGQLQSKLFRVTMNFENRIPTSVVEAVNDSPESRLQILEELGYDFFDFDIWSAWLFLEESTAEKIIREYLIPWFAQELVGRLRTFSARSLSEIESKFDSFNKLFVFLHLQPLYRNLAWVIVDGGAQEKGLIEKLRATYQAGGWNQDNFLQFCEHDFEKYYPQQFQSEVDKILEMPNGRDKQACKAKLLGKVESWIKQQSSEARKAFEGSASEVIQILKEIEHTVVSSKGN